ncbi:hypothetical protein SDC9_206185 [bioreactor metagenome]|uniref:Uncharacterized protein n=1 Tax=bioreactor metagenome TaxID=1076179 RepID=A0A645J5R2_9ZZZZ
MIIQNSGYMVFALSAHQLDQRFGMAATTVNDHSIGIQFHVYRAEKFTDCLLSDQALTWKNRKVNTHLLGQF